MPEDILRKEIETYEREKSRLVAGFEGDYVLIVGTGICGTFKSQSDAIAAGIDAVGNRPILVKKIEQIELPQDYVSNLMAI